LETNGGAQAHALAAELRAMGSDAVGGRGALYEHVAVVGDCFGVDRFVTAYRALAPPS